MNEITGNIKGTRPVTVFSAAERSQQIGLDTSGDVTQVIRLSDPEYHHRKLDCILSDTTLTMQEKLELYNREEDRFDRRVERNMALVESDHRNRAQCIANITNAITGLVVGGALASVAINQYSRKQTDDVYEEETEY